MDAWDGNIALKSLDNNRFCGSNSVGRVECSKTKITKDASFEVIELGKVSSCMRFYSTIELICCDVLTEQDCTEAIQREGF